MVFRFSVQMRRSNQSTANIAHSVAPERGLGARRGDVRQQSRESTCPHTALSAGGSNCSWQAGIGACLP